jgi:hypothetical protein
MIPFEFCSSPDMFLRRKRNSQTVPQDGPTVSGLGQQRFSAPEAIIFEKFLY